MYQAQVADLAARALLVAGDELGARREALGAGDAPELEAADRRVVGLAPRRAEVADVGERVADRRHLPVEDRARGGRAPSRGEHRVAEAEVAVDDRRRAGLGQVLARATRRRARPPRPRACGCAPTGRGSGAPGARGSPSACRSPRGTPASRRRGSRRARRRAARRCAAAPSGVSSAAGTSFVMTSPSHALHDVERRADDGLVVAHREDLGHARGGALDRAQSSRASRSDVVRARRQRRARRAADDDLAVAAADEVRHVRVALADRLDARDRPGAEPVLVEERRERLEHEQRRRARCARASAWVATMSSGAGATVIGPRKPSC